MRQKPSGAPLLTCRGALPADGGVMSSRVSGRLVHNADGQYGAAGDKKKKTLYFAQRREKRPRAGATFPSLSAAESGFGILLFLFSCAAVVLKPPPPPTPLLPK